MKENQKKVCSKCGELKPFSEYYKQKSVKDGLQSYCKSCGDIRNKERGRTKDGLITQIYRSQCLHSKTRRNNSPTYKKKELKEWMFSQKIFHELYDDWVNNGYDTMIKPSCDRTDDYLGYSLSRLTIMTWGQNKKKGYEDRKNGVNNKLSKSVISTNKTTGKETEYYSMTEAERKTGIFQANISKACLGKINYAGSYYWRYSTP